MSLLDRLDSCEDVADLIMNVPAGLLMERPDLHAVLVSYNFYGSHASMSSKDVRGLLTKGVLTQIANLGGVTVSLDQVGPSTLVVEVSKDPLCTLH